MVSSLFPLDRGVVTLSGLTIPERVYDGGLKVWQREAGASADSYKQEAESTLGVARIF